MDIVGKPSHMHQQITGDINIRAVSWVSLHPNGCAQLGIYFTGLKTPIHIFSPHPKKPKPNFTQNPTGQPSPPIYKQICINLI